MKQKFNSFLKLSTFTLLVLSLQGCLFAGLAAATGAGGYYFGKKASQRGDERIKTETLIQAREEMEAKQKELSSGDQAIQSQINSKVAGGGATNQIAVYPEVKNGIVILHGKVPDAQTADKIIASTRQTQGVSQIISNLVITNQARQKQPAATGFTQPFIPLQPMQLQPQIIQPQYNTQQLQPVQYQQPQYQPNLQPQQQYFQQPAQQQIYQQQPIQAPQYNPQQIQPVTPEQYRAVPSPYGVQGNNTYQKPPNNINTSQIFVAKQNSQSEYEKKNYLNHAAPRNPANVPASFNNINNENKPQSQANIYNQILAANQQPPPSAYQPPPVQQKQTVRIMDESQIDSFTDNDSGYVPPKAALEAKRRQMEREQYQPQNQQQTGITTAVQPTIVAIPVPVPVAVPQINYDMYQDADADYLPLGYYNPYRNNSSTIYNQQNEIGRASCRERV